MTYKVELKNVPTVATHPSAVQPYEADTQRAPKAGPLGNTT